MEKLKIYRNYGVLANEKRTIYTYENPKSDIFDEVTIKIPDGFEALKNADGEVILSASQGWEYTPDELLTNVGGEPAFRYVGKDGGYRTVKCEILKGGKKI